MSTIFTNDWKDSGSSYFYHEYTDMARSGIFFDYRYGKDKETKGMRLKRVYLVFNILSFHIVLTFKYLNLFLKWFFWVRVDYHKKHISEIINERNKELAKKAVESIYKTHCKHKYNPPFKEFPIIYDCYLCSGIIDNEVALSCRNTKHEIEHIMFKMGNEL